MKTPAAIEHKRLRRPSSRINDLFGFRIVVDHVGLLDEATDVVMEWGADGGLSLLTADDYFECPGDGAIEPGISISRSPTLRVPA